MSASPAAAGSPTRHSTRSPTASMNMSTANTTSTTPSKTHHQQGHQSNYHHLTVGHATHSPAQSASGEAIQGRPSEAGGLHTSTSRGNILLPPSFTTPSSGSIPSTPADLLSVISSTTSNQSPSSRPHSPSAPNSPVLFRSSGSSRPTSPRPSNHNQEFDPSTTPQLDSSAVFERDVEFANDHLLTGSEAIDLAAAPVLSEVALSVTSNEPSSLESSGIIGNTGGQASPFSIAQSLDSALYSNTGLPPNAIIDSQQDGNHSQPLSEQLRQSVSGGARSTSEGTGEFNSPPPSLSLSPSNATGSPVSSTPGSPIQSLYQSSSLVSAATSGGNNNKSTPSGGVGSLFAHQISDGGAPVSGLDMGDGPAAGYGNVGSMPSPPGSAMSGVSLSGGQNDQSKRRLSMISYADIINSERLSDSHSGFSSPTPSSAMSLSAAALPVQNILHGSTNISPAVSPGLAGIGSAATGTGSGTAGVGSGMGSALYSPITSPEGEGALSPSVLSEGGPTRDATSAPGEDLNDTSAVSSLTSPSFNKPANNRTETMSSVATERYYMPGQLPASTPPITQSNKIEDKDVTPTNSSIKNNLESGSKNEEQGGDLKESTSSSSWNMIELGKALVGSAAGAVGSVLAVSGIGSEPDEEDIQTEEDNNKKGL